MIGNADAHADPSGPVGDLGLREQAHVGLADGGGSNRVAGYEGHRKADLLGQLSRERVEDAGKGQRAYLVEDSMDAGFGHRGTPG